MTSHAETHARTHKGVLRVDVEEEPKTRSTVKEELNKWALSVSWCLVSTTASNEA